MFPLQKTTIDGEEAPGNQPRFDRFRLSRIDTPFNFGSIKQPLYVVGKLRLLILLLVFIILKSLGILQCIEALHIEGKDLKVLQP